MLFLLGAVIFALKFFGHLEVPSSVIMEIVKVYRIDLFGVTFWMPELALYSFYIFYYFFGEHDKIPDTKWVQD